MARLLLIKEINKKMEVTMKTEIKEFALETEDFKIFDKFLPANKIKEQNQGNYSGTPFGCINIICWSDSIISHFLFFRVSITDLNIRDCSI